MFACLALGFGRSAPDPDPRLHERAHEQRPDGALMVGAVALADAALVARRVARLVGGERAEAERCQETHLDGIDDSARPLALEHREGQTADRENLVRAEGRMSASRRASSRRLIRMPGPVSRFRGCTSTFAPGRVASCGRASSTCPRLTIASIRSDGTSGATRASVASRSERFPMIRQYCLGIGAPAISGEGLEAGTIPTGQHQGPEALRRRLHFPLRCAEPCGRFA